MTRTTYTPANPYVYECPALDRLAQLAGATGDPDEGYPDGGAAVVPTDAVVSPLDEAALRAMLEALDDEGRAAVRAEIERLHAVSR